MSFTRRSLISSSAVVAGTRLIPSAYIATLLAPSSARAEVVTTTLALASIVAGLIAAHNRRGDDVLLSALNQKLDLVIEQVASVQQSVAMVLDSLATLPNKIDKLLKEEQTRRTQLAIQGAIQRYHTKIRPVRKNYDRLADLRQNTGAMQDLQSVLNDLYREVSLLDVSKAYGPNTALLIPSAINLEHALLEMRGDRRQDIAERLEQNLSWFAKVTDPNLPSSAAAYRLDAIRRLDEAIKGASATQFGRALNLKPGSTLFDCVGIDDYRERTLEQEVIGVSERAKLITKVVPERVGPRERMFANITLEERPVPVSVAFGDSWEIRNADFTVPLVMRSEMSPVLRADDPRVPPQCTGVLVVDQVDPAARASSMRERIEKSNKTADLEILKRHLASIGEERARISYADAALAVMVATKPTVEARIRSLRA